MFQKHPLLIVMMAMGLLIVTCYGASDYAEVKCYASQVFEDSTALYDGCEIANSNDHSIARFTWWPNKGTTEWVQYQFLKQMTISWVEVYWFDDLPNQGKCRVPQWWKLQYQDREDMQWKEVEALSAYGTLKDGFNKLTFKPVKTDALRMVVQLQSGFSGGILEWNVEGMQPPGTALLDTVKTFRPQTKDRYYPSEEQGQLSEFIARPDAPQIASVTCNGQEYRVLEKDYENWGLFAFVDKKGDVITLRRSVGQLNRIKSVKVNYPENYMHMIRSSKEDLLGNMILEGGNEPSFEDCAGFLPEIEEYTFLSNERCEKNYAVDGSGQIGHYAKIWGYKPNLETIVFSPDNDLPRHGSYEAKRGLIGNYLPAIDYGFYDSQNKIGWELIAFANTDNANRSELEVYIYLKIDNKGSIERKYYRLINDQVTPCDSSEFFSSLLKVKCNYEKALSQAMEIDIPDPRVIDASKASLVRAFITYHNAHPQYAVDGEYGKNIHDAFPPTTISMVNSCIEWNLHTQAAFYLNYFFDTFVKENGTIAYYGPSDSEYGQLLDLVASYVNHSKDASLLAKNKHKILAIINRYLAKHRQSKIDHPQDSPYYGLIKGVPEADAHEAIDYYYAGNMWLWRGWVQIGRVMERSNDNEFKEMGKLLQKETGSFREAILKSIKLTMNQDTTPAFIPPTARIQSPFVMTENFLASYTNYRYHPEMLSSDFLPSSYANAMMDYRRLNGGELMGMTRFVGHLDDWPMMNHSYALLAQDRIDHYLLAFYGDLAHHRMPGTFSAFEQVNILDTTNRTYAADYCVPAQLITPMLTRWMLVFEEKDADRLWLCRAAPARWLDSGQSGIAVRRASTRWGSVDFSIKPNGDQFHVVIDLSEDQYPAEVRLRISRPAGREISQLISKSNCTAAINTAKDYMSITKINENRIEINVQ